MQAAACGALVKSRCGGPGALVVYASPLQRAAATARILCQALGVDAGAIAFDERLREASFGIWEGLTTGEVKAQFPAERRKRKADRWGFRPPGGDSIASTAEAMMEFLAELPAAGTPVLVSHCSNIRALLHLLGGFDRAAALASEVPHASVYHWDGASFERHDPPR